MFKGIATILGAAILLTGCASTSVYQAYPGAALPANETAVLVTPALLDILAIDGAPLNRVTRLKTSREQRLALLPGEHTLQVRYYDPLADESRHELYLAGPVVVRFQAVAGSIHVLCFETSRENPALRKTPEKFRAWVGDTAPPFLPAPGIARPGSPASPPDLPATPARSVLLNDTTP